MFGVSRTGRYLGPAHGQDAGKGLSPEPERPDGTEVVDVCYLARGMPEDGRIELVARHAGAVVADADELAAVTLHLHGDGPGSRIDGVLDEFFDHRGRPLDDLAGGDLVHEVRWQNPDPGHV